MCILELDHANWPEDLNTWAIIIKLGSFFSKTFFFQKKLKLEIFIKQWGSRDQKCGGKNVKKIENTWNFQKINFILCGKFQVEILYTFEVISVPVILYVEKHMSVNVIESTLSKPRTIICK